MNAHAVLLDELRSIDATLVEAALSLRIARTVIAEGMDEDDAVLAMTRMRRFALAIARAPREWRPFGVGVVNVAEPGSSATAPDGTRVECKEPRQHSVARRRPLRRLHATMHRPGLLGTVGVRLCEIDRHPAYGTSGDTSLDGPLYGRVEALAAVLTVHAGAAARADALRTIDPSTLSVPVPTDGARNRDLLGAMTLLLGQATDLAFALDLLLGSRAEDHELNVVTTGGRSDLRIDDASRARLLDLVTPMLRLSIEGPASRHRPTSLDRTDVPNTSYSLMWVRLTAKKQEPADPMQIMRSLALLGLETMPTLLETDR